MLARYLLSEAEYNANGGYVKQLAFNPLKGDKISVYNMAVLTLEQVEETGEWIATQRAHGHRLHGRAELETNELASHNLNFTQDNDPRLGHGHILGWPPGAEPEARKAKLAIAQKLAQKARLVRRIPPFDPAAPAEPSTSRG
jgi:hypothetical protein